jgi:hypothetical protein
MALVFLAYKYRNPFPILFSLFLRTCPPHVPPPVEPDQITAVVVPTSCSYLPQVSAMPVCATLSLADEEKSSAEIDSHTTDHQSDALVRNVFFSISFQLPVNWKGESS